MNIKMIAGVSVAALLAAACTTTDPYRTDAPRNNTATGAIAGALGGAVLGYLTNTNNSEEGRKNALIAPASAPWAARPSASTWTASSAPWRLNCPAPASAWRVRGTTWCCACPAT